jgi:hypothetical protein
MPDFDLSIDIYVLAVMLALAMIAGFLLRSRQLAKKKRQIMKMESEVLAANAELLEMQKDYCEMEGRVKGVDSPVIPINMKQDGVSGKGKSENF